MSIVFILPIIFIFTLFIVWRFLRNVQPDEGEIAADLKELKTMVASFKGGFVPWSEDISSNELDQILERKSHRSGNGVFLDRDNQPIFAYAFRRYIGPGRNSLLYVLSLDHEYVFRTTTKGTDVSIDGQNMGIIRQNGVLYDIRNREVAEIKRFGAQSVNKIYLGQKEVAKIALPGNLESSRALEIQEGLQLSADDHEKIRLLTVYELAANIGQLKD